MLSGPANSKSPSLSNGGWCTDNTQCGLITLLMTSARASCIMQAAVTIYHRPGSVARTTAVTTTSQRTLPVSAVVRAAQVQLLWPTQHSLHRWTLSLGMAVCTRRDLMPAQAYTKADLASEFGTVRNIVHVDTLHDAMRLIFRIEFDSIGAAQCAICRGGSTDSLDASYASQEENTSSSSAAPMYMASAPM